jgi:hypothetical protein
MNVNISIAECVSGVLNGVLLIMLFVVMLLGSWGRGWWLPVNLKGRLNAAINVILYIYLLYRIRIAVSMVCSRARVVFSWTEVRQALGRTQSAIQWVPGIFHRW